MKPGQPLIKMFAFALITLLMGTFIYGLHRLAIFSDLKEAFDLDLWQEAQAFFIGFLSDFWIASLFSLLILIISGLIRLIFNKDATKILFALVFTFLMSAVLHHPYVSFFKVPLMPFHLNYLIDPYFIGANFSLIFNIRFFISAIFVFFMIFVFYSKIKSMKRPIFIYICFLILALGGHVYHIKYKIQWHIPAPLQLNLFESLYVNWSSQTKAKELTQAQIKQLFGQNIDASSDKLLEHLLCRPEEHARNHQWEEHKQLLKSIKSHVLAQYQEARKPLALIYLMESFRFGDVGLKEDDPSLSLTPQYDEMIKKSIVFTNAYSTGTVTRGAQEAVFCGFPGSVNNSTMRSRSDLTLNCLSDRKDGFSFWFHGGDGRFDNQEAFWKKHRVSALVSKKQFADNVARNSWGIGDVSFVHEMVPHLSLLHYGHTEAYSLGMFLTMTNHIPWDHPDDLRLSAFGASLKDRHGKGPYHMSAKTVSYADIALGDLIRSLKDTGLWQQMLLIVAGDHGIAVDYLNGSPSTREEQLSHINLALAGGIIEQALADSGKESVEVTSTVSQMDVAPFLAYVFDMDQISFFGQSLLMKRTAPVFVDLGDDIYFPQKNFKSSLKDILSGDAEEKTELTNTYELHYYRAFRLALEKMSRTERKP